MENLVYNARAKAFPDWKTLVFSDGFRWCKHDDPRSLTRFIFQVLKGDGPKDSLGLAHPDIIFEIGDTKLHGFVDCTFGIVPRQFEQVLIIMVYFSKYDLYVPVYFVLLQVSSLILFISHIVISHYNISHNCII